MVPIALRNSQFNWRSLIRPMLLLSLGLHALFFLIPTASEPEAEPSAEEKVELTSLPTESPAVVQSAPAAPTPRAVATPPPRTPIVPPAPRVSALPPIRSAAPRPAAPRAVAPQAVAPASVQPATASTAMSTTPAATGVTPTSPAPLADPFTSGFPRYANAQQGSFGLPPQFDSVSQKTDDSAPQVAAFFEPALRTAQYEVAPIDQPGRTVYQVSKAGQTRYLTLLPNPDGAGTSIVLSSQPLPADLGSDTIQDPALTSLVGDLGVIIGSDGAGWQDVSEITEPLDSLISESGAFFTALGGADAEGFQTPPETRAGVTQARIGNGDPQTAFASLSSQFAASQIVATPTSDYGSGTLYEVSRTDQQQSPPKTVTVYLVLVPTTDARTMLFLWDRSPQ